MLLYRQDYRFCQVGVLLNKRKISPRCHLIQQSFCPYANQRTDKWANGCISSNPGGNGRVALAAAFLGAPRSALEAYREGDRAGRTV